MNKFLTAVLLISCAGALCAQAPADKKAAEKKPAAEAQAKPAAAPAKAEAAKPAAAAPAKPAAAKAAKPAEEPEESMVMIDDKAEPAEGGRFAAEAYAAEPAEPVVPGGLPASYGQCKGVLNDAGRSILVFESPDDGEITFVQLSFGKAGVSWKRLDSIRRSGAEAGFN